MSNVNAFIWLEPNSTQENTQALTTLLNDYSVKQISVNKGLSGVDADTLRFKLAISQLPDSDTGLLIVKDSSDIRTDAATLKKVVSHVMEHPEPRIAYLSDPSPSMTGSVALTGSMVSVAQSTVSTGMAAVMMNAPALKMIRKNFDTSLIISNKSISGDDVPLKSPSMGDDFSDDISDPSPSTIQEALTQLIGQQAIKSISTYPPLFKDPITYYDPTTAIPSNIQPATATPIPDIQTAVNTIYQPSSTENMMYSWWFLVIILIILLILLLLVIFAYSTQEEYYYF